MENISRRGFLIGATTTFLSAACATSEKGLKPAEITPPAKFNTPTIKVGPEQTRPIDLDPANNINVKNTFKNQLHATGYQGKLTWEVVGGYFRRVAQHQVDKKDSMTGFMIRQIIIADSSNDQLIVRTFMSDSNRSLPGYTAQLQTGLGNPIYLETHWEASRINRIIINGQAYEIQ